MTEEIPPFDAHDLQRSSLNHCFGCSRHNPHGLHLPVELAEGEARCEFHPRDWHQGWQEVVHGGVLAWVLDEVMGYTVLSVGWVAVTARMEVRYRQTVTCNDHLEVTARIVSKGRSTARVTAEIKRQQSVLTEAAATFVKVGTLSRLLERLVQAEVEG